MRLKITFSLFKVYHLHELIVVASRMASSANVSILRKTQCIAIAEVAKGSPLTNAQSILHGPRQMARVQFSHGLPIQIPKVLLEQVVRFTMSPGLRVRTVRAKFPSLEPLLMHPASVNTGQAPNNPPFWTLADLPNRPRPPNLFPFSTHQSYHPAVSPTANEEHPDFPILYPVSSLQHHIISSSAPPNPAAETMSRWNPQGGLPGDDDMADLATTGAIAAHIEHTGQFVPTQGDALLLNTMDQQRSSARDWLELLQQEPAAEAGETLADGDDQLWDFGGLVDLEIPMRPADVSRRTS